MFEVIEPLNAIEGIADAEFVGLTLHIRTVSAAGGGWFQRGFHEIFGGDRYSPVAPKLKTAIIEFWLPKQAWIGGYRNIAKSPWKAKDRQVS